MKSHIFLLFAICVGMVLPSIAINPKKINGRGEFQPYYGYTIVAPVDYNRHRNVVDNIAYIIRTSSLRNTYAATREDTYHMSIYTIYSAGNNLIPPVKRWVDESRQKISKTNWLPDKVLEKQNNEATCVLQRYLNQPLNIRYAKLDIGENIISLQLELYEESLQRIRLARKQLARVYEHPNSSLEPINKKLHITLAYAYKKVNSVDPKIQRTLEQWARWLDGSQLQIPYVYLYSNVINYKPYQKPIDVDCRAYDFWK